MCALDVYVSVDIDMVVYWMSTCVGWWRYWLYIPLSANVFISYIISLYVRAGVYVYRFPCGRVHWEYIHMCLNWLYATISIDSVLCERMWAFGRIDMCGSIGIGLIPVWVCIGYMCVMWFNCFQLLTKYQIETFKWHEYSHCFACFLLILGKFVC